MKLPKFLVAGVLKSENAQEEISGIVETEIKGWEEKTEQERKTKTNKEISKAVSAAVGGAKDEWAVATAKALQQKVGRPRKYIVSTTTKDLYAQEYPSGKNWGTLYTAYTETPGSIQCINRISGSVLGGGYVIKKIEGKSANKKDLKRLIKFFDRPNPDDTIETLVSAGIVSLLGYGSWYMEKVPTKGTAKSDKQEIAELYNLDATKIKLLVNPAKKKKGVLEKIGYERLTDNQKKIIYTLGEVCYIRRPDPKGNLYGRAVLEDGTSMVQLLLRALTYNISILRNGGRPPSQIVLPEDCNENDADAVSAFFEKNFMGAQNAGKTPVLFKGAKLEALGITPADMSYLELLMFGVRLVSGQYEVPLFLIGFPEGSNRAIASEAKRAYYYSNIYPLRKMICNKLTKDIIVDGFDIDSYRIDFRTAGLEESEAARRDIMAGTTRGLYKWNEGRIKLGLLPIDEPWADEFYLLGSKNDSLLPLKDAIGATPQGSKPDAQKPRGGTREQGEGAEENSE